MQLHHDLRFRETVSVLEP